MTRGTVACLVGVVICAETASASAGQTAAVSAQAPLAMGAESSRELPFAFDGPPPPTPPQVIARDAAGRVTIRAVKLASPLHVDGRLDEALYVNVPPISDFVQMEPQPGAPATERTDMWVAFDRDQVYVAFRCWESQPARVVAHEMRRDSVSNWNGDDIIAFIMDTFYDRRNAVQFTINPIGGRQARRSPTNGSGTVTGTPSGKSKSAGSTVAGPLKRRSHSDRCVIARPRHRSGASTSYARTGGRTSSPF